MSTIKNKFIDIHIDEPITIFLNNGIKLTGMIIKYDDSCIIFYRPGSLQLVNYSEISTIMPINDSKTIEFIDEDRIVDIKDYYNDIIKNGNCS